MLARVSNIESFRRWRDDEEQSVEQLVEWLTTGNPSEAMRAGTAFHKALEDAAPGDYSEMEALGHRFILPDCDLALPTIRELRSYGMYGPLRVTGQVDGLQGRLVIDHKTTSRFDAERYLDGYQWRYYLDLFEADVFRWNVFVVKRVDHQVYEVSPPQTLEAFRYPGMRADCDRLAADYYDFAVAHMPMAA